ncbi:MAG: hypothetical protein RMJ15_06750 [Nitrososphaerota archaeon]|nr:hypothetical protein [Candidatus Bathyarchaeota archaeon]MDW8023417.1 hypothetical protein [Nitrososphaerota archaeon]
MPFKDECKMCGRVLPYGYLRRCWKCGKLFCLDCMVPEVSTGDTQKMFCLNCARRTVSPKTKTKYGALTSYLKFRAAFTDTVKLSFAQIDGIIGDNLPMNAFRYESWWENSQNNAHAKAWLEAGWKTSEVNLKEGYVVFQKIKGFSAASFKGKTGSKLEKPFTPAPSRIFTRRKPSKTKISKLYARLKNIERQRSAQPKLRGSFKPKPAHEKRTFKPNGKLQQN